MPLKVFEGGGITSSSVHVGSRKMDLELWTTGLSVVIPSVALRMYSCWVMALTIKTISTKISDFVRSTKFQKCYGDLKVSGIRHSLGILLLLSKNVSYACIL